MEHEEERRLITAATLLAVLKRTGFPMTKAAKELGVSASTLSHWRGVSSTRGRKIGIPSDDNLIALTDLVYDQYSRNLNDINALFSTDYLHPRVQSRLLFSTIWKTMKMLYLFKDKYEEYCKFVEELNKLGKRFGMEHIGEFYKSSTASWGPIDYEKFAKIFLSKSPKDEDDMMEFFNPKYLNVDEKDEDFRSYLDEMKVNLKEVYGE